jgi:hypothetical protein
VEAIGGRNGWYFAQPLWWLRGMLDLAVGGPGMGRGRRHSRELRVGDVLDCWRVAVCERPHRLLLVMEMMAPGDALLEIRIQPESEGRTRLEMVSRFLPKGLAGLAYWYGLLPIHDWLFKGTLAEIAKRSEGRRPVKAETFPVKPVPECRL